MAWILRCFVYICAMVISAHSQDLSFYRHPAYARFLNEPHLHLQKRVAFQEEQKPNDVIVFQGPSERRRPSQAIPEECKRLGFCETVPDYPTELVERLVKSLGDEVVKSFPMDKLDDTVQIAQRLGGTGADLEIEMCNFTETIVYPQKAQDAQDKWYTVVNLKDKPLQGFRVEICNQPKAKCSGIANLQDGYSGGCKQKYFYRTMNVLDDDGSHVVKSLKMPGCCSCVLTTSDMFLRK